MTTVVAIEPPERGTPEWDVHHDDIRRNKHEQNKRRRQFEKMAVGATIAASKVEYSCSVVNRMPENGNILARGPIRSQENGIFLLGDQ